MYTRRMAESYKVYVLVGWLFDFVISLFQHVEETKERNR